MTFPRPTTALGVAYHGITHHDRGQTCPIDSGRRCHLAATLANIEDEARRGFERAGRAPITDHAFEPQTFDVEDGSDRSHLCNFPSGRGLACGALREDHVAP